MSKHHSGLFASAIYFFFILGFQYLAKAQENRFPILEKSKAGFIDSTGNIVIPPQFDWASDFSGGLAAVEINRRFYLYREVGDTLGIPYYISSAEAESLWNTGPIDPAIRIGKFGFIDTSGNLVIPAIYDDARDFSEGLAAVNIGGSSDEEGLLIEGGKWGYIDKSGQTVIDFHFDYVREFAEGLAYTIINLQQSGFIDKTGKLVMPFRAEIVNDFKKDYATYQNNYDYGYIDKAGKRYPGPLRISEGMKIITNSGMYGYADSLGNIIVNPTFDYGDLFTDGVARVRLGEKWGFIKKDGAYLCQPVYDFVYDYAEGMARVKIDGLIGFVDSTCNLVIAAQFQEISDFHNGLAQVSHDWIPIAYIDKIGRYVWKYIK